MGQAGVGKTVGSPDCSAWHGAHIHQESSWAKNTSVYPNAPGTGAYQPNNSVHWTHSKSWVY